MRQIYQQPDCSYALIHPIVSPRFAMSILLYLPINHCTEEPYRRCAKAMFFPTPMRGKQDRKNEGYFLCRCRPGTDLVDGGRTGLAGESFLSPMLSDTEHGG